MTAKDVEGQTVTPRPGGVMTSFSCGSFAVGALMASAITAAILGSPGGRVVPAVPVTAAAIPPPPPALSFEERRPGYDTPEYQAHVTELLTHVEPAYKETCRMMLMGESLTFGQGFQDWLVMNNFGYNYRKWGQGFYIDIGTNSPTEISNTLALEKCLGWDGICVEAQERYHAEIRSKRSCKLYPHCVLGKAQTVQVSGFEGVFSVVAIDPNQEVKGKMQCKGVGDMMKELDIKEDMEIDLASIDIEGAEGSVLKCWPFDTVKVRHWLVETNKQEQKAVDWFFHAKGYSEQMMMLDWMAGTGFFIDTLYERMERPHKTPVTGPATFVTVDPRTNEVRHNRGRTKFGKWPYQHQVVWPNSKGEGSSQEWLECAGN